MSGMKFRRTCSLCNATFFSPDRRANYCIKCAKKRVVKHVPPEPAAQTASRVAPRHGSRVAPAMAARKPRQPRGPRISALTAEVRERIVQMYREKNRQPEVTLRDLHSQIASQLWIKRQLVADVLREVHQAETVITDEQRTRAIEMYRRFVESGHRPEGGRRRAISAALGVPYKQVMKVIREWSVQEYQQSPTPSPSRLQLFEVEKLYWKELENQRYRLTELPDRMAEELKFITRWQVLRWLDVLHDDQKSFANVPDPPSDVEQRILECYGEYLESSEPPEHGLHYSIAGQLGSVTPRQVHKVLQNHRHKKRAEYPLL